MLCKTPPYGGRFCHLSIGFDLVERARQIWGDHDCWRPAATSSDMRAGILPKCDAMSKRKFTKKKHALNKRLTTFPQQDFALHNGLKSCQRREMGCV
jgi:hypothetical protein